MVNRVYFYVMKLTTLTQQRLGAEVCGMKTLKSNTCSKRDSIESKGVTAYPLFYKCLKTSEDSFRGSR